MKKVMIINGPNLNMLGYREPDVYGRESLQDIINYTEKKFASQSITPFPVTLEWFQSNIEGELISKIHSLIDGDYEGLVINPGAYSHTSVALYDALAILKIPIVEVHLTNTYKRESFRHNMLTAKVATMIMSGLGHNAYYLGVYALLDSKSVQ